MLERLDRIDAKTELATKRAEIIDGILKNGLKSSSILAKEGFFYFGSFDYDPRDFIAFRLILPPHVYGNSRTFFKNLRSALYVGGASVLPVMAERMTSRRQREDPIHFAYSPYIDPFLGDKPANFKQVLESRISSSFIIVVNETMENLIEKSGHFLFSSARDRLESLEYIGRLKEERIDPNRFSYFIFPQEIWEEYRGQNILIDKNVQVKIVEDDVKKRMFGKRLLFYIPNYESTIWEILEERKEPIWVHGVRLPTEKDLIASDKSL